MTKKETDYQELFNKTDEYYSSNRQEILSFIPGHIRRTLEFGCGRGDFSAFLKERFNAETWAVEIHRESAEIASQKLDRVLCKDAINAMAELPDDYFDCIFFLDVLEHLTDPYRLLEECRTKLTSQGRVIASIPNIRYYRAFADYVFRGKWEYRQHGIMDIGHLRFFTFSSIREMFRKLNYSIRTLQGIHPTGSKTYFLLNLLLLNRLWDVRYKHFIVIAQKDGN
jgi:2-polyprenyl-3-methyl-5-hydroxy-6-metoxy-1,4-benzoquinol methylase